MIWLSEKKLKICRVEGLSLCHSTVLFSSSRPLHCLLLMLFCYYLSSSATKETRFSFFFLHTANQLKTLTFFFLRILNLFFFNFENLGRFQPKEDKLRGWEACCSEDSHFNLTSCRCLVSFLCFFFSVSWICTA